MEATVSGGRANRRRHQQQRQQDVSQMARQEPQPQVQKQTRKQQQQQQRLRKPHTAVQTTSAKEERLPAQSQSPQRAQPPRQPCQPVALPAPQSESVQPQPVHLGRSKPAPTLSSSTVGAMQQPLMAAPSRLTMAPAVASAAISDPFNGPPATQPSVAPTQGMQRSARCAATPGNGPAVVEHVAAISGDSSHYASDWSFGFPSSWADPATVAPGRATAGAVAPRLPLMGTPAGAACMPRFDALVAQSNGFAAPGGGAVRASFATVTSNGPAAPYSRHNWSLASAAGLPTMVPLRGESAGLPNVEGSAHRDLSPLHMDAIHHATSAPFPPDERWLGRPSVAADFDTSRTARLPWMVRPPPGLSSSGGGGDDADAPRVAACSLPMSGGILPSDLPPWTHLAPRLEPELGQLPYGECHDRAEPLWRYPTTEYGAP